MASRRRKPSLSTSSRSSPRPGSSSTTPSSTSLPPRDEDRETLLGALREHVYPAYERYLEALREYLPAAREEIGLWSTPDGESAYRASIKAATSLDEEPHDLHAYGLAQIQTINEE